MRNKRITKNILQAVFNITNLTFQDLNTKTRDRELVVSRQIIFKLLRENTKWSLSKISSLFSKDHSTVSYSIKTINNSEFYDIKTYKLFLKIKKELKKNMTLKKEYESVVEKYINFFIEKHDFKDYDGGEWIGLDIRKIYYISDMFFNFDDIRIDIDKNAPKESIIDWYWETLESDIKIDFKNWLKRNLNKHQKKIENKFDKNGG